MWRSTYRIYEQQGVETGAFDILFCNLDNEIHVIYHYIRAKGVARIFTQLVISLSS